MNSSLHQAPPSMGFSRPEVLEWVAISFSRESPQPKDRTQVSHIVDRRLPSEPPGKPLVKWPEPMFVSLYLLGVARWLTSEKVMAPHSSTLAWKIPWTEEPGRLRSMGLQRVRHDWATSLSLFTFMHWRRKWQPTSVFLPEESQGRGSLVGCHLWGRTESDTTEAT